MKADRIRLVCPVDGEEYVIRDREEVTALLQMLTDTLPLYRNDAGEWRVDVVCSEHCELDVSTSVN